MKSKPRPSNLTGPSWKLLSLVIFVELAYLAFFYSQRLSNSPLAAGLDEPVTRATLAAMSVPGLLPENKSLVARAVEGLVASEHLAQRGPVLAWSMLILLAASGMGQMLWMLLTSMFSEKGEPGGTPRLMTEPSAWPDRLEVLVVAQGLGMNALSLLVLGLGLAGWLYRPLILGAVIILAITAFVLPWLDRRRNRKAGSNPSTNSVSPLRDTPVSQSNNVPLWERRMAVTLIAIAASLFLVITFLGAVLPATDFDVREYHLQGPKEFFLTGRITFSPDNVYRNMPFGSEMVSLLGMKVVGDWWWGGLVGQVVLSMWGVFTAAAVYLLGRRLFGETAGWIGGTIYLTTPWIYRLSVIPYAESSLAFYLLIASLAAHRALTASHLRRRYLYWLLAGSFAGSALSCKYTAVISHVLPLVAAAVMVWIYEQRRGTSDRVSVSPISARIVPTVAWILLGTAVAAPWFVRNWAWTGNPTYPLLYRVFGGYHWDDAKNQRWEWGHRVSALVALGLQRPPPGKIIEPDDPQDAINVHRFVDGVIEITAGSDWLSPLLFALAPLALLRRQTKAPAMWLWLFVLFYFIQWWLLTHRLNRFWVPMLPIVAVLAGGGATWTFHISWRCFLWLLIPAAVFFNFSYMTTSFCAYNDFGQALESRTDPIDPAINWMNDRLPEPAMILAVGEAALFHLDRASLYNTVFDSCLWEEYVRDRTPEQVLSELKRRGITHVYVNWHSIQRHREPRGYGFPEFVQPSSFRALVAAGVLRRLAIEEADQAEYAVVNGEQIAPRECYQVIRD